MIERKFDWAQLFVGTISAVLVGCGSDTTQPVQSIRVPLYINEVQSSNYEYPDDKGKTADWIELYNDGQTEANLEGYYLSDNSKAPLKQVLPADVSVPAKGVLVLWADGTVGNGPLHLDFKLSASGEEACLSDPDGKLVNSTPFGSLPTALDGGRMNVSWARFPDGTGLFEWCTKPTPNALNGDACAGDNP